MADEAAMKRTRTEADAQQDQRTFTTYSNRNLHFKDTPLETSVLWHDSSSNEICWQSVGNVTPWHGAFVDDNDGLQRKLFFNASTTPETISTIALRSTVLLRDTNGDWTGHDCRTRPVIM